MGVRFGLSSEGKIAVFENNVLRRIFVYKRKVIRGDWRKLRSEVLHNLYSAKYYYLLIYSLNCVFNTLGSSHEAPVFVAYDPSLQSVLRYIDTT
jgi:hypothetical protein